MNRKYKNLFLLAIMLLFVQLTSAQTRGYVQIPEPKRVITIEGTHVDEAGKYDTAQFRQKYDVIFQTISKDIPNRTQGDGTVYLLKRNHVYVVASTITPDGMDLHIKGEDGQGRMPLILHDNPPGSGVQGRAWLQAKHNIYLENFEYDARNPDNSFGNRSIDFRGPDSRIIVKGCRFTNERGGNLAIEAAGLRAKLYVYDCIFGNAGHPMSFGGNGRAIDIRLTATSGNLDTVVFKNNTIYNLTDRVVRSMGEVCSYMEFDHNTIVNNEGVHGCVQLGNSKEAVVTNNIFANPLILGNRKHSIGNARGEQTQQPTDKNHADAAFAIITHNGLVGRLATEGGVKGITVRNNNIFFKQEFLDLWTANPQIFDSPTVRVASDAVREYLTGGTEAQMSITEELPFDWNDMEAGNLGSVSSYKDLVVFLREFCEDPARTLYSENWSVIFPHEWNAAYPTSSRSYTAADGGFPLGDLNWFPDDKAKWMTSATKSAVKAAEMPAVGIEINRVYPNPFGIEAKIDFSLFADQNVEIAVCNMNGQKLRIIKSGYLQQGEYEVTWDGKDGNGNVQSIGIYLVVISGSSGNISTKLMKGW